MKKLVCLAAVFSLLALSGLAVSAADDKTPTAKDVMKLTKGPKSAFGVLKTELGSKTPDWEKLKKVGKDFKALGVCLPSTEAPKGDQAAFEVLAKAFAKNSTDLAAAIEKEDLAAVKAACGKIGSSCMACHKAHKP